MFFEGAEKKLEIVVSKQKRPLTQLSDEFWHELVKTCEATVLSCVKNQKLSAYLLSESSLFVWDDRILMLTCGQTKLIESAKFFINKFGEENIDCLFYQRKNEYRSHLQPTSFIEDANKLGEIIDGHAVRFGKLHSHHTLLFHTTKNYSPEADDKTCELLMYDMAPEVIKLLTTQGLTKNQIRDFFKLDEQFVDFEFDDFVFEPYGYSLNGIRGEDYLTIHVTPQETSPYVSFETNLKICDKSQILLQHFINTLRPGSFDVLTYNCPTKFDFGDSYVQTMFMKDRLSIGYDVHFRYFNKRQVEPEKVYIYKNLE